MTFTRPRLAGPGERMARVHISKQIPDTDLRRKVTPDYRMGCKCDSWVTA